jgi:ketosteroid isomerase-like protein
MESSTFGQSRDTARAMSEENLENFHRLVDALRKRDVEAALEDIHPDIELHPGLVATVAGGAAVYRGHEGVRQWFRDSFEVFGEVEFDFPDVRDLGDRVLALGHLRVRGSASGAPAESPFCYVNEYEDGKPIRIWTYLDPKEALEAAGLSE